jgi:hypothetical protein
MSEPHALSAACGEIGPSSQTFAVTVAPVINPENSGQALGNGIALCVVACSGMA